MCLLIIFFLRKRRSCTKFFVCLLTFDELFLKHEIRTVFRNEKKNKLRKKTRHRHTKLAELINCFFRLSQNYKKWVQQVSYDGDDIFLIKTDLRFVVPRSGSESVILLLAIYYLFGNKHRVKTKTHKEEKEYHNNCRSNSRGFSSKCKHDGKPRLSKKVGLRRFPRPYS